MNSFFLQSCYLLPAIQATNNLLTFCSIKSPLCFLDLLINMFSKIAYPQLSSRDYLECAFSPAPWSIMALSLHSSKSVMDGFLETFYQDHCPLLPTRLSLHLASSGAPYSFQGSYFKYFCKLLCNYFLLFLNWNWKKKGTNYLYQEINREYHHKFYRHQV